MSSAIGWGNWVRRRMFYVGFRRKKTFSAKIGCTQDQLSRWLGMTEAPATLRKGFDEALSRHLRTDLFTLFTNWRNVAPDAAPIMAGETAAA